MLYAGVSPVKLPDGTTELPEEALLPVGSEVYVTVPLSSVAANAILVVYAGLLVTTLFLYTRALTRREEIRLGEVVAGLEPGRESVEEITLFKSVGLAVQDAATAARVYELAREAGVGAEIEI